jgi:hypothetical protein
MSVFPSPQPTTSDYSLFTNPDFNANDYANAILAGEPYPQVHQTQSIKPRTGAALESAKEDISVAISKLDLSIEDVTKQIKNLVRYNHHHHHVQCLAAYHAAVGYHPPRRPTSASSERQ